MDKYTKIERSRGIDRLITGGFLKTFDKMICILLLQLCTDRTDFVPVPVYEVKITK